MKELFSAKARSFFPACATGIVDVSSITRNPLIYNRLITFLNSAADALSTVKDECEDAVVPASITEILDLKIQNYYAVGDIGAILDLIKISDPSIDAIEDCPASLNDPEIIAHGWLQDLLRRRLPKTDEPQKFYSEEKIVQILRGIADSANAKRAPTGLLRKHVALKLSQDVLHPNRNKICTPWYALSRAEGPEQSKWFVFEVWTMDPYADPVELVLRMIPLDPEHVTIEASLDLMTDPNATQIICHQTQSSDPQWWTLKKIMNEDGSWDVVHISS